VGEQLRAYLQKHRRIALDSCVFIYEVEAHPRYVALTRRVFSWLEQTDSQAVTSAITMTELLVAPYKAAGARRVAGYLSLLATYPNLEWIAADLEVADQAARLRAAHGLKTPDALQAATAVHAGATALVTNDPAFERVREFETLILDRLL
jgi:predicted nucleic acid-binding protein